MLIPTATHVSKLSFVFQKLKRLPFNNHSFNNHFICQRKRVCISINCSFPFSISRDYLCCYVYFIQPVCPKLLGHFRLCFLLDLLLQILSEKSFQNSNLFCVQQTHSISILQKYRFYTCTVAIRKRSLRSPSSST